MPYKKFWVPAVIAVALIALAFRSAKARAFLTGQAG